MAIKRIMGTIPQLNKIIRYLNQDNIVKTKTDIVKGTGVSFPGVKNCLIFLIKYDIIFKIDEGSVIHYQLTKHHVLGEKHE